MANRAISPPLAHGVTVEGNPVGAPHESVHDRVGKMWAFKVVMPFGRIELADHHGCPLVNPTFEDFHKILLGLLRDRRNPKIIQDQLFGANQASTKLRHGPI